MSNNDLLYSRLAIIHSIANELSIDLELMREALLILRDQIRRQSIYHSEEYSISKEVIERLKPLCYRGIIDVDSFIEATDMLIKDPDGITELLRYLDYLDED